VPTYEQNMHQQNFEDPEADYSNHEEYVDNFDFDGN
jgi:hypothetical protein